MNAAFGAHRPPYRRGDFHLVDTKREGTYWQSPEGLRVRIASGEAEAACMRREAPAWPAAIAMLFGRAAGQ